MILLCNGDSWTQGDSPAQIPNWEAEKSLDWYDIIPHFGEQNIHTRQTILYKFYDSQVWPKVLGEKLGVETWNCGRLGASNDKIIRTTINSIEYLESLGKTDIFVVIGLTSINRYSNILCRTDEFKNQSYTYDDYRQGGGSNSHFFRATYDFFIERDINSNLIDPLLVKKDLVNLINIQNYLYMKGYDYLIFNAFDSLMKDDFKKLSLYKYINFDNIYNRDLKAHFRDHIDKKFNTAWNVSGEHYITSHPRDISHIEWGNELHTYIKKNYYEMEEYL